MSQTSHNTYFDGSVQSLGFEHASGRSTVGVIAPGTYDFNTEGAERMTVIAGVLEAIVDGESDWEIYPKGSGFEVPASSHFQVKAEAASAYLCEFL
ncbi:MAG: pyrimidine/purine nucleoside phosphorylase [Acidimicrobiales bacterium]